MDSFIETMKTTIKDFYGESPKDSESLTKMVNEFHSILQN